MSFKYFDETFIFLFSSVYINLIGHSRRKDDFVWERRDQNQIIIIAFIYTFSFSFIYVYVSSIHRQLAPSPSLTPHKNRILERNETDPIRKKVYRKANPNAMTSTLFLFSSVIPRDLRSNGA